jgi:hypothetical protein
MRFKYVGVLLFLFLTGIGVYLLILHFYKADISSRNPTATVASATGVHPVQNGKQNRVASGNESIRFNYQPPKPVGGVLKGVIEVGSTGFNSFVVHIDSEKRWEVVAKDFGVSLVYEGLVTTENIRTGLQKYMSKMFDNAVDKNNIHFVVSSGAQKEPKIVAIAGELKKIGYPMMLVSAEQEGSFGMLSTIPPSYRDRSFYVDIGSGNTKVAWMEGGSLRTIELPGSKYFERGLQDEAVYNSVREKINLIPTQCRRYCFIIGGVPYQLANQSRKGEERYTVLNAPDSYVHSNKRVASGLTIYKAIVDTTNCKLFIFDWDANFAIGYLLSLS